MRIRLAKYFFLLSLFTLLSLNKEAYSVPSSLPAHAQKTSINFSVTNQADLPLYVQGSCFLGNTAHCQKNTNNKSFDDSGVQNGSLGTVAVDQSSCSPISGIVYVSHEQNPVFYEANFGPLDLNGKSSIDVSITIQSYNPNDPGNATVIVIPTSN